MDFELSTEHQELRSTLRSLLETHATDADVTRWDTTQTFPAELYARLAELGVCGLTFPEEHGGAGPDYIALAVVVEELARVSAGLTWAYLPTVSVAGRAVLHFGSDAQRASLLPAIAEGRVRVAIALTEPEAGSDLGGLTTSGVRDGDDVVVTGQKVFTTGADSADFLLTLVRTRPGRRMTGALTFVLVPAGADGVSIRPLEKMAGQAVHTCEVFFDQVRLPADAVLGQEGAAAEILFSALDSERVATAAMGLGLAQGAQDKALRYAGERRQFGVSIIEHQAVAHLLADMAIDTDSARLLTYRAATLLQRGMPSGRAAAVAKVAATEAGTRCANRGMQVLGGYSYMLEYGMERYWREAKLYEIAAGTNQILRDHIVKELVARTPGGRV